MLGRRKRTRLRDPMPLVEARDEVAAELAAEIARRVREHSPRADSFYYNGGTVLSLLLTGAAAVLAGVNAVAASACSAAAAFVIALSRALNFGGRWRWHLQRQGDYCRLAYRLNRIQLLEGQARDAAYLALFDELERQRALDAAIPGSGEPIAEKPDAGESAGAGTAPTV